MASASSSGSVTPDAVRGRLVGLGVSPANSEPNTPRLDQPDRTAAAAGSVLGVFNAMGAEPIITSPVEAGSGSLLLPQFDGSNSLDLTEDPAAVSQPNSARPVHDHSRHRPSSSFDSSFQFRISGSGGGELQAPTTRAVADLTGAVPRTKSSKASAPCPRGTLDCVGTPSTRWTESKEDGLTVLVATVVAVWRRFVAWVKAPKLYATQKQVQELDGLKDDQRLVALDRVVRLRREIAQVLIRDLGKISDPQSFSREFNRVKNKFNDESGFLNEEDFIAIVGQLEEAAVAQLLRSYDGEIRSIAELFVASVQSPASLDKAFDRAKTLGKSLSQAISSEQIDSVAFIQVLSHIQNGLFRRMPTHPLINKGEAVKRICAQITTQVQLQRAFRENLVDRILDRDESAEEQALLLAQHLDALESSEMLDEAGAQEYIDLFVRKKSRLDGGFIERNHSESSMSSTHSAAASLLDDVFGSPLDDDASGAASVYSHDADLSGAHGFSGAFLSGAVAADESIFSNLFRMTRRDLEAAADREKQTRVEARDDEVTAARGRMREAAAAQLEARRKKIVDGMLGTVRQHVAELRKKMVRFAEDGTTRQRIFDMLDERRTAFDTYHQKSAEAGRLARQKDRAGASAVAKREADENFERGRILNELIPQMRNKWVQEARDLQDEISRQRPDFRGPYAFTSEELREKEEIEDQFEDLLGAADTLLANRERIQIS